MCEQCNTDAMNYGELMPGWFLMKAQKDGVRWKAGEWALIRASDPVATWTSTPTPNPAFGLDEAAEDALYEQHKGTPIGDRIVEVQLPADFASAFSSFHPNLGYRLVAGAMERGYDRATCGSVDWWLYDYIGEWLETAVAIHHSKPHPASTH